jgi:lipopolysaccharide/colanic/teichoic acid biosynthesis glycosyltransferase
MILSRIREPIVLFIGDIFAWALALWGTLFLRYFEVPTLNLLEVHLRPFLIIFLLWTFIFFIADLYKRQTLLLRKKLPKTIFQTQVANSVIALIFFYFIPYFGITPKIVLFIDLALSFVATVLWRMYLVDLLRGGKKQKALIIGNDPTTQELLHELNNNPHYKTELIATDFFDVENILHVVKKHSIKTIIFDFHKEKVKKHPDLYKLLFTHAQFIDTRTLYEEVFERIPLSLLYDNWFIENILDDPKRVYDISRRIIDIVVGAVAFFISLVFYPFIIFAIKLDDGGDIFISQKRIGKDNKHINLVKFRTMTFNDSGGRGGGEKEENKVTKVGRILRKTRLDELPQLWNVMANDLSLIGPRPELPDLVLEYNAHIPYYSTRYIIKPGLSGWAQMYHEGHPHHMADIEETKNKLSHDLYYIKNRSLWLDIKILLKTIKTLISRSGR